MGHFVSTVRHLWAHFIKWLRRILWVLLAVFVGAVACTTMQSSPQQREIYVSWSETDAVAVAYTSILRSAGYRLTDDSNAEYTARFYHEQRTQYCGGNARVYVRARMVVYQGSRQLDMSSTEQCAHDRIAAHLQLQSALEDDRRTYIERLRTF